MKVVYLGNYEKVLEVSDLCDFKAFISETGKENEAIKVFSKIKNIEYFTVSDLNSLKEYLYSLPKPDLMIVGGFGIILDDEIIEWCNRKVINIHPGVLPGYRGRHPLHQSILDKSKDMGISIHVLNKKIDSGMIVEKISVPIDYNLSYKQNEKKLLSFLPKMLFKTLKKIDQIDFSESFVDHGPYRNKIKTELLIEIYQTKSLNLFLNTYDSNNIY